MRTTLRLASVFAFLVMLSAAYASDPGGTWKGAFEFEGSSVALTFNLQTAGNTVTGTVEGLPTTPAEIHDGKLDGDTVTFWVNTDYEGQTYKLVYKGTMAGDQIGFMFGTDDGSWSTTLTATKNGTQAVPDVAGTWTGAFEFEGTSTPLTFNLKNSGNTVTGNVEGLPTTPAEIHDGHVDGDSVSFWVNTDYQGQTYKLVYKGKVSAGQIGFTFGTDDGSWSTTLTATKSL